MRVDADEVLKAIKADLRGNGSRIALERLGIILYCLIGIGFQKRFEFIFVIKNVECFFGIF